MQSGTKWTRRGCKILIDKGAVVNAKAENDVTALWIASKNGRKAICEWLLAAGAEIDARDVSTGTTPLWLASRNNDVGLIEILINNRANVNAKAINGYSPLMIASQKGHLEIDAGADINARESEHGSTALCLASLGQIEVVKYLLKKGADLNIRTTKEYQMTALGIAKDAGKTEIVKILKLAGGQE